MTDATSTGKDADEPMGDEDRDVTEDPTGNEDVDLTDLHDDDDVDSSEAQAVDPPRSGLRRVGRWAGLTAIVLLGLVVILAWVPVSTSGLGPEPDPTSNFDEAVSRFETLTADEQDVVFESCRSRLLHHGERTEVTVVLYHGLTNCPKQYVEFGNELFESGANVLILRAPRHGRAGSDGDSVGSVSNVGPLTAQKLRDYADDSIDIATGLGDEIRVTGLSMGGVLASWSAQFRDEIDRVVVVAPAINIPRTPSIATTTFMNLSSRLPNISLPGQSKLDHAYAGESTRGLLATFTLARATQDSTHQRGPAATEVVVVINPDDDQVDASEVKGFADRWARQDGRVDIAYLPAVGLPHDVIDEDQPEGDVDLVYPIVLDLLDNGAP
jgi:esterase/lipase